jgi:PAS domain S-box-containing protein
VTGIRAAGKRSEVGPSNLGRLAHWDDLVADLATAIFVTDDAGRAVVWNQAATQLFGWAAADTLGRPVLSLLLPREFAVDAVAILTAVATGKPWTGEVDCNRSDRASVSVFLTLSAVYDEERAVLGFVGEARDITATRELLAELRAADARQRAIVARSRDATLFFDIDGMIRWASPASNELLAIEPEALIGQNGLEFACCTRFATAASVRSASGCATPAAACSARRFRKRAVIRSASSVSTTSTNGAPSSRATCANCSRSSGRPKY